MRENVVRRNGSMVRSPHHGWNCCYGGTTTRCTQNLSICDYASDIPLAGWRFDRILSVTHGDPKCVKNLRCLTNMCCSENYLNCPCIKNSGQSQKNIIFKYLAAIWKIAPKIYSHFRRYSFFATHIYFFAVCNSVFYLAE